MKSLWDVYAASWEHQLTPLKPGKEDCAIYADHLKRLQAGTCCDDLVIMGVTPELYFLGESLGFKVKAIDQSAKMISSIWPGKSEDAFLDDWLAIDRLLSVPGRIVCDGGLHLLSFSDQISFFEKFQTLVLSKCSATFRLFLPFENRLSSNEIFKRFESGEISSVSYLKTHLWHASDLNESGLVRLGDIWSAVESRAEGQLCSYFTRYGISAAESRTFDVYRNNDSAYYFRAIKEIEQCFEGIANFKVHKKSFPRYHGGEYFPVVTFCHCP